MAAATVDVNKEFTMDELKAEGEKVYAANCVACHQANGKGVPGTFAALDGSKIATGAKGEHINIVMNGKTARPWRHSSTCRTCKSRRWSPMSAILGQCPGDLVHPT